MANKKCAAFTKEQFYELFLFFMMVSLWYHRDIRVGILWRYYGQEKVLDNPIILCAFYNIRICCNTSLWNNKSSRLRA